MSFSRGRGRIATEGGRAIIIARCPLCGEEHRYPKGAANGEELAAIRNRGFTDEWLPCQADLPGNFWRVTLSSSRKGQKSGGRRPLPGNAS